MREFGQPWAHDAPEEYKSESLETSQHVRLVLQNEISFCLYDLNVSKDSYFF